MRGARLPRVRRARADPAARAATTWSDRSPGSAPRASCPSQRRSPCAPLVDAVGRRASRIAYFFVRTGRQLRLPRARDGRGAACPTRSSCPASASRVARTEMQPGRGRSVRSDDARPLGADARSRRAGGRPGGARRRARRQRVRLGRRERAAGPRDARRRTPSRARARTLRAGPRARTRRRREARAWLRVGERAWVRERDTLGLRVAPPPAEARPDERWIDVDLERQVVTAYRGERPVFATLVSTGRGAPGSEQATPPGTYRIWVKLRASDMDNLENLEAADELRDPSRPVGALLRPRLRAARRVLAPRLRARAEPRLRESHAARTPSDCSTGRARAYPKAGPRRSRPTTSRERSCACAESPRTRGATTQTLPWSRNAMTNANSTSDSISARPRIIGVWMRGAAPGLRLMPSSAAAAVRP